MHFNLKPAIKESLFIYVSGLLLVLVSFCYFSIMGYPLVRTATQTLNVIAPPLYMVPIFFPFGMLVGEIFWIWEQNKEFSKMLLLLVECSLIGFFSFLRFAIYIPLSGHTIILFFFLMHQGINNRLKYPVRVFIGIIVLIITSVYKLFLWNDPFTFLLGALLGVGIWLPGYLIRLRKHSE